MQEQETKSCKIAAEFNCVIKSVIEHFYGSKIRGIEDFEINQLLELYRASKYFASPTLQDYLERFVIEKITKENVRIIYESFEDSDAIQSACKVVLETITAKDYFAQSNKRQKLSN